MAGEKPHSNIVTDHNTATRVATANRAPVDLALVLVAVMHAAMLALLFWGGVGYLMLMLA